MKVDPESILPGPPVPLGYGRSLLVFSLNEEFWDSVPKEFDTLLSFTLSEMRYNVSGRDWFSVFQVSSEDGTWTWKTFGNNWIHDLFVFLRDDVPTQDNFMAGVGLWQHIAPVIKAYRYRDRSVKATCEDLVDGVFAYSPVTFKTRSCFNKNMFVSYVNSLSSNSFEESEKGYVEAAIQWVRMFNPTMERKKTL